MKEKESNKIRFVYFKSISRVLLVIFFAFSVFLYLAGVMEFLLTTSGEEISVPSVTGKRFLDVYNRIKRAGLNPEIEFKNIYDVDDGLILQQYPETGEIVSRDSIIKLVVSRSSLNIEVPKVTDLELPVAKNKLSNVNFQGKTISLSTGVKTYIPSDKIGENVIIAQNPRPGERIQPDTKIHLLISSGPDGVDNKMADVTRQKIDLCYDLLLAKGLYVNEEIVETGNKRLSGTIISQTPRTRSLVKKGQEAKIKLYWYAPRDKNYHPYLAYEKVDFIIPDHYTEGHYEAYIEDDKQKRIRFSRMMKPGQRVRFLFQRVGNAKVTVLSNKKLVRVQSFKVNDDK